MIKMERMTAENRWALLRVAACAAAFLILSLIPLAVIDRISLCLWFHLTGKTCLSCGMTRAFAHVLHGDLRGALSWNPLAAVTFPLCAMLFLEDLATLAGRLQGKRRRSWIERLIQRPEDRRPGRRLRLRPGLLDQRDKKAWKNPHLF